MEEPTVGGAGTKKHHVQMNESPLGSCDPSKCMRGWGTTGFQLTCSAYQILGFVSPQLLVPELLEAVRLVPVTSDTLEMRCCLARSLHSTAATFGELEGPIP